MQEVDERLLSLFSLLLQLYKKLPHPSPPPYPHSHSIHSAPQKHSALVARSALWSCCHGVRWSFADAARPMAHRTEAPRGTAWRAQVQTHCGDTDSEQAPEGAYCHD